MHSHADTSLFARVFAVLVMLSASVSAQVLVVEGAPFAPPDTGFESGADITHPVGAFRFYASEGDVTIQSLDLTTFGSGDWVNDVDAAQGVSLHLDDGDTVFDATTDTALFAGPGASPGINAVLTSPVMVPAGTAKDIWVVLRVLATAGAALPETFGVEIASPGDVTTAENASVTISTSAPRTSVASVVVFEVTGITFLENVAGEYAGRMIIHGSGFVEPVSVSSFGVPLWGTPVVNSSGTEISGVRQFSLSRDKKFYKLTVAAGLVGPRTFNEGWVQEPVSVKCDSFVMGEPEGSGGGSSGYGLFAMAAVLCLLLWFRSLARGRGRSGLATVSVVVVFGIMLGTALPAQSLTVNASPLSPLDTDIEAGVTSPTPIAKFRFLADTGSVTVDAVTLTASGNGDWVSHVDATSGIVLRLDDGDGLFDPASDSAIATGPGESPKATMTLNPGLVVTAGNFADLWVTLAPTATAGTSPAETFSVSIATPADVSAGAVPVLFGAQPPRGAVLSVVDFSIIGMTPGLGRSLHPVEITGSGFNYPIRVLIGGVPLEGSPRILDGGTRIVGLYTGWYGDSPVGARKRPTLHLSVAVESGRLGPRYAPFIYKQRGFKRLSGCACTARPGSGGAASLLALLPLALLLVLRLRRSLTRR